ncbi:DNA repair protein complementing XP-A cells homolog isoform X1 [Ostrinia nubilalis]|uniref:DNA repair protein complementing XP-A cells homolog isoform X1 n=1 Tax=Ostrinia nubilalis TaxID=29057 RepID=UPI003082687A
MAAEINGSSNAAITDEIDACDDGEAPPDEVDACDDGEAPADEARPQLSAAQRARIERNRLRARALQDARLVRRPPKTGIEVEENVKTLTVGGTRLVDSGGGFLLEEAEAPPPPRVARDAPVVDPSERPTCMDCERTFPQSYLFDTFGYGVCDSCRDEDGAHSLLTRTEAKSEFRLKDCDLDLRPPPLRCVRRRNPHRGARSDMRLYLRAQVEARAREVWGSEEALERERERRTAARARAGQKAAARRLRALRMDTRSSLFDRAHAAHAHRFGPERHDAAADEYARTCLDCGHVETYEKM